MLLLFPFHVSRVYNAGDPFYVKGSELSVTLSYVLGFISTWHMQLLFLLAGASTYFALSKRSGKAYVAERAKRLVVPLVFGFFVLIPPQTWYGARFNSGYPYSFWHYLSSGDFLHMNIHDGGDYFGGLGLGQLWFILFLFLISLIVLPLLLWGRTERGTRAMRGFCRRISRPVWWLLPGFLIVLGEGLPDIAGKNLFYYLVFFVLGYVTMYDKAFMDSADRLRLPALGAGAALALFWVLTWRLRDSLPNPSLQLAGLTFLGMLATWLVLVGMLGCGRRYLDRTSPSLAYLGEASYPVYIIHQTVIVIAAFYLVSLPVAWPIQWLALLMVAVAGTFALYKVVRRVGALRFLFGMRPATRRLVEEPVGPVVRA